MGSECIQNKMNFSTTSASVHSKGLHHGAVQIHSARLITDVKNIFLYSDSKWITFFGHRYSQLAEAFIRSAYTDWLCHIAHAQNYPCIYISYSRSSNCDHGTVIDQHQPCQTWDDFHPIDRAITSVINSPGSLPSTGRRLWYLKKE